MKIAILFCLVAAVSAGHTFLGAPGLDGYAAAGVASTGESVVQRQEDGIGNYAVSFAEQGATGGTSQQEAGDVYGRKQGSYSLGVADGRARRVDWVADEFGFRARVSTNEQGTAPSNPADVLVDSAAQGHVAHVAPVAAAPIARPIVQQAIAAPVAYSRPIIQHAVAAPVAIPRPIAAPVLAQPAYTKVVAQPIVQHAIAAPQPLAYSSLVSHAAPVAVAKQIVAQPIVQQALVAPRPVAYSSVVSHAALATPYAAGVIAKPAYGLGLNYGAGLLAKPAYGLGLNYGAGLLAKPAYGLGLNYGLGHGLGLNYGVAQGLPLNYGVGLNGIGLGLAPYWRK